MLCQLHSQFKKSLYHNEFSSPNAGKHSSARPSQLPPASSKPSTGSGASEPARATSPTSSLDVDSFGDDVSIMYSEQSKDAGAGTSMEVRPTQRTWAA